MTTTSLWYLLIGFLLGNGMPHFAFGAARKVFRSPFGRESAPAANVGWGLFNFFAASALVWWRVSAATPVAADLAFLLGGFWLTVVIFGLGIRMFLFERGRN